MTMVITWAVKLSVYDTNRRTFGVFNAVLYRRYMFRRLLHHPEEALYQHLKLTKT
jgi:hypothetical protein